MYNYSNVSFVLVLHSVPGMSFKSGFLTVRHFQEFPVVVLADNDSEDEGTSRRKVRKKVAEPTEVAGEQEEGSGEMADGEADDDDDEEEEEEDAGEEDSEASQQAGGVDVSSEGEGRQTASASMSTRSESKPYSSVTHKCEVRHIGSVCRRER